MESDDNILNLFESFQVGPNAISVYGLNMRTTCAIEAYNGVLGRRIMGKSNFYLFMRELLKEELAKFLEWRDNITTGGWAGIPRKNAHSVSI